MTEVLYQPHKAIPPRWLTSMVGGGCCWEYLWVIGVLLTRVVDSMLLARVFSRGCSLRWWLLLFWGYFIGLILFANLILMVVGPMGVSVGIFFFIVFICTISARFVMV